MLAILRFIGVFNLCLLLLDPKIEQEELSVKKTPLVFLFDNSASIGDTSQQNHIIDLETNFSSLSELQNRFEITRYSFGNNLKIAETLDFKDSNTNLDAAIRVLEQVYPQEETIVIIASDGQQNSGRDYTNPYSKNLKVFPVVIGDTTRYQDVRLSRINANRFAFSGNQFQVEIRYTYFGKVPNSTEIRVFDNGKQVYKAPLTFERDNYSGSITVNMDAGEAGLHRIRAEVNPLLQERNTSNNILETAVEVIDDYKRIGLIATSSHPDIGAIKRSVETDDHSEFKKLSPTETVSVKWDADIYILLNPNSDFESVYRYLEKKGLPTLTIAGPETDWDFVNGIQNVYSFIDSGLIEDYQPESNTNFNYYHNSFTSISDFPPLKGALGELNIYSDHQNLFLKSAKGLISAEPLISLIRGQRREVLILGTDIWKWRLEHYRQVGDFQAFDTFLSNFWNFLLSGGTNNRLTVNNLPIYEDLYDASLQARFLDESLRFDASAELQLQLKDSIGNVLPIIQMSRKQEYFEASLNSLQPGSYTFQVSVTNTEFSKNGKFIISKIDTESKNSGADLNRLTTLAENSGGEIFFPDNLEKLKDSLLNSNTYRPVQISQVNVVSLIDIKLILGLIFASFAAEWFLRKFHGLI